MRVHRISRPLIAAGVFRKALPVLEAALLIGIFALVGTGEPAVPSTSTLPDTAQPSASTPGVRLSALQGLGRFALVWGSHLYVADGAAGVLRQIPSVGVAATPTWSHDGHWLAYHRLLGANTATSETWIARADGGASYRVGQARGASPDDLAWSPTTATLAAVLRDSSGKSGLWLTNPGGISRPLRAAGDAVTSFAWSPDGAMIAYVATVSLPVRHDVVSTIRLRDGQIVRRFTASADTAVVLAGWWPNGRGLVFWLDPDYSQSLAADGLDLFALALDGSTSRAIAGTLPYRDWLSWAPDGHTLLLVDGGGREVWRGKHLVVCDVARGTCRRIPQPASDVSVDPAWAPDGSTIAFVRAQQRADSSGGARTGVDWTTTRTLWLTASNGTGAHELSYVRGGVFAPAWATDGRALLFWQDDALWLWRSRSSDVVRIIGPFPQHAALTDFFGHVSWTDIVSWSRP
ncbi:MAG TPA: hypothetical protein VKZ50_04930 [bacterium]|nr:hypothetical protein [bacterium]